MLFEAKYSRRAHASMAYISSRQRIQSISAYAIAFSVRTTRHVRTYINLKLTVRLRYCVARSLLLRRKVLTRLTLTWRPLPRQGGHRIRSDLLGLATPDPAPETRLAPSDI